MISGIILVVHEFEVRRASSVIKGHQQLPGVADKVNPNRSSGIFTKKCRYMLFFHIRMFDIQLWQIQTVNSIWFTKLKTR